MDLTTINAMFLTMGAGISLFLWEDEIREIFFLTRFYLCVFFMTIKWLIMLGSIECYVIYEKEKNSTLYTKEFRLPTIKN